MSLTATTPSVSAQAARSARDALRQQVGEDTYRAIVDAMASPVREEVRDMGNLGWVPTSHMRAFYDAAATVLRRDVDTLTDEAVFRSTAANFRTVWKPFFSLVSDDAIIKRIPSIYKQARSHGTLTGTTIAKGRASLTLSGWPEATERDLRTLSVAIRAGLDAMGRKEARCTYTRRGTDSFFEASWRA